MEPCTIRRYQESDRAAIRRIAFDTGFMGDSVGHQYADRESFADLFTAHYTDREPHNALTVEQAGSVVGYCLASRDARRVSSPWPYLLKHFLLRGVCFRPGTSRFYGRLMRDRIADLGRPTRAHIDFERYPSHTHNSLLAGVRRGGLSRELFYRVFDHMREQGSPGMHGEVMASNQPVLKLAAALGYVVHGEPYLAPGTRGLQGERLWIQALVRDLQCWEPGAWKDARWRASSGSQVEAGGSAREQNPEAPASTGAS